MHIFGKTIGRIFSVKLSTNRFFSENVSLFVASSLVLLKVWNSRYAKSALGTIDRIFLNSRLHIRTKLLAWSLLSRFYPTDMHSGFFLKLYQLRNFQGINKRTCPRRKHKRFIFIDYQTPTNKGSCWFHFFKNKMEKNSLEKSFPSVPT